MPPFEPTAAVIPLTHYQSHIKIATFKLAGGVPFSPQRSQTIRPCFDRRFRISNHCQTPTPQPLYKAAFQCQPTQKTPFDTSPNILLKGGFVKRFGHIMAFVLFLFLLVSPLAAQPVSLTILHTNDTHGHLFPFSYPTIIPPGSELAALIAKKNIGGIARRATLIKRLRAELEPRGTTVWVIDAGDFSDGTSFSIEYHGEADIAAMNAAGYNFGTLGNHEFNNPLARLKSLLGQFQYPVLCANATENSTGKTLLPASTIRQVGPLKIGLFGLITREAAGYPAGKEGIAIAEEAASAGKMVSTLKPEADIVMAISHAGEELDKQMGETIQGLDVIVGGHSHSRLPLGEFKWHSPQLKSKDINGTIIVQAHQWGGELGRLDLLFDKDDQGIWHIVRYHEQLIPITSEIPADETVAAIVDRFWKPIAHRYGEVIGQATDDFTIRGDDLAPYNLVTDLIREHYGTDIELENMGSVRAPLIKGPITQEDLVTMDPFENMVVTFKVTGQQLKEILRMMRPAVSGIRYRTDNGTLVEVSVGGQPVVDDRVYSGVTNSFFAERALKGFATVNTGKVRREVITECLRKKGTVKPVYDSRRVVFQAQKDTP
jgi:2',3'-cyclic-nucleotide 2'-phosphodiesterase (5'-nucleotidase family)